MNARTKIFRTKKYLNYVYNAQSNLYIHSPFVYRFMNEVIKDRQSYPELNAISKLRRAYLKDGREVRFNEFGAGSSQMGSRRTVRAIARYSAIRKKYGRILFLVRNYMEARQILELGTGIGISTAYLAAGNPEARVHTIEGNAEVAEIASQTFQKMDLTNIESKVGTFETHLPSLLQQLGRLDMAFLDGNHTYDATLGYFDQCLGKVHRDSVIILDDIYWSEEMADAWEAIKAKGEVRFTVDLYQLGLVFFKSEVKVKQDFFLRY